MSERQITNRIRKLQELEAQKAELESQIAQVKGQIQAEMKEAEELKAGCFIIRWVNVVSQRIDAKALKAAYPYLYIYQAQPKPPFYRGRSQIRKALALTPWKALQGQNTQGISLCITILSQRDCTCKSEYIINCLNRLKEGINNDIF